MSSTPTTRNRFERQGTGDNSGTWGQVLNTAVFELIDEALDGHESIAVNGNVTLTSVNYSTDQARKRILTFTGTGGFAVTVPGVSKFYVIRNAAAAAITVKTAGGTGASVAAGALTGLMCDGTDCYAGVSFSTLVPISSGGTGAATAATARVALGVGQPMASVLGTSTLASVGPTYTAIGSHAILAQSNSIVVIASALFSNATGATQTGSVICEVVGVGSNSIAMAETLTTGAFGSGTNLYSAEVTAGVTYTARGMVKQSGASAGFDISGTVVSFT